jgi:hypothetical protein
LAVTDFEIPLIGHEEQGGERGVGSQSFPVASSELFEATQVMLNSQVLWLSCSHFTSITQRFTAQRPPPF